MRIKKIEREVQNVEMNDENKEDREVQNVEMNDENKEIEKFRMSS